MPKETCKQRENEASSDIEDLTVNQGQAEAVKGGAIVDYYLKVEGIDGESTSCQRATDPRRQ